MISQQTDGVENEINDVFDSFLKNSEIDGNNRQNSEPKMGNPHIKRKILQFFFSAIKI